MIQAVFQVAVTHTAFVLVESLEEMFYSEKHKKGTYMKNIIILTILLLSFPTICFNALDIKNCNAEELPYFQPPTILSAVPGDSQVTLEWTPVVGAVSYGIRWGTQSGVYPYGVHIGNMTTYAVTGLNNGTMYYFVVMGIGKRESTDYSGEVSVTPAAVPDTINDLSVTANQADAILSWSAPDSNGSAITEYEVQYGTTAGGLFDQTFIDDATPGATIADLESTVEYQFRVIARNAVGDSDPSNVVTVTPLKTIYDVIWTDAVGVDVNGNSLTKTEVDGWGNSGAASTQMFAGDGGVQITASETNKERIFGLSTSNENAHTNTVDFGIELRNNGWMYVRENGVTITPEIAYTTGNILSVVREGNQIHYKRNGVSVFSHDLSLGYNIPLLVDTALYTQNSTINNAQIILPHGKSVPLPVTGLETAGINEAVVLTWDSEPYSASYKVKYGTQSGTYTTILDVGNVTEYTVESLQNGFDYYFVVSGVNELGEGVNSSEAVGMPGAVTEYIYDNRNRLDTVTEGSVTIDYNYDDVGNRVNKYIDS